MGDKNKELRLKKYLRPSIGIHFGENARPTATPTFRYLALFSGDYPLRF
jgi:hypothetical protein